MLEPSWYAGWGTLSLVNAGLAHAYGRSRLLWLVLSLLLGPIASLILVLVGRHETSI